MSPWRHPPPEPSRERAHLAAVVLLALLGLLAAVVLAAAGCAPQVRPECPLGSRPTRVDTGSGTEGGTSAKADVPSQSATVGGTWKGSSSADWSCATMCRGTQLLKASRDEKGVVSIECSAPPAEKKP